MKALRGIFPATVSPFAEDGRFDSQAMRKIVAHQIGAGVHGLYICGGTGEGLLMTVEERQEALEVVLDEVGGRAAVITHIGAFSTEDTVALARHASGTGADAVAALPPAWFYTPDDEGLLRYYAELSDASQLPLLVYNIPQRTGIAMTESLFERLLKLDNVVGMKDSSGDLFSLGHFLAIGNDPVIFEGDDAVLLSALLAGAIGGIGGSYNVMPGLFVQLWDAVQARDTDAASAIQLRINETIRALMVVDTIVAVKQTLSWMGMGNGQPRTPIRPLTGAEIETLRQSLERVGFFDRS